MADQQQEEEETTEEPHVVDVRSFTGPERLECQEHFDATFGDLCQLMREAILPGRPAEPLRLEGVNGRVWPDQVAQFLLWVQARRDDPDVELEDFDRLNLAEVQGAFTRGLLQGKARTRSTRSSPGSSSVDSSEG